MPVPLNVMKALFPPVSLSDVWVSLLIVLPCQSNQARVETNTVGFYLVKKQNMYWKCAGIFISRCQLWYSKIYCWKTILQYLFLYTPEIHCSAPPFFVSYQCSFIMDSLITLFLCYYTHEFCECACLCFALLCTIAAKLISPDCLITGCRKCLLPWRSVNVMFWQTLPSDTWQRALLLSGPPPEYADTRACVRIRATFPAPLICRFLRLFVFSQTGGWFAQWAHGR